MTHLKTPKWDWRVYLTPAEAKKIAQYDRAVAKRQAQRKKETVLHSETNLIRNRAIQRAKYAATSKAAP